jgi:hypothetical protein
MEDVEWLTAILAPSAVDRIGHWTKFIEDRLASMPQGKRQRDLVEETQVGSKGYFVTDEHEYRIEGRVRGRIPTVSFLKEYGNEDGVDEPKLPPIHD